MTTPILLPPLPALAESTVYMWVRHESGRYDSLPVDILALIAARDLEVARAVLESAKAAVNHEHLEDPQEGTSDEVYDRAVRDCCDALNELKVKHHE